MQKFDLYGDIAKRAGGDIYIGVVGPVRTGKSTFIQKFMQALVLPNIEDPHRKQRVIDEMPQAADGATIMTTKPQFVPDNGVKISLEPGRDLNVRLIDCVGYMVDGAVGHMQDGRPRLLRTPWHEAEIPFEQAAELGTKKVITDHSTIGVVITTDGSVAGIPRENYIAAEERVIAELKHIGKPFSVVVNTSKPHSKEVAALAEGLKQKYGVPVLAMSAQDMEREDAESILQSVLQEFPVKSVEVSLPKWLQVLPRGNPLIEDIIKRVSDAAAAMSKMRDDAFKNIFDGHRDLENPAQVASDFGTGTVSFAIIPKPHVFYKVLSDTTGAAIDDDFKLMSFVKQSNTAMREYSKLKDALSDVERVGYGVVQPTDSDIELQEPEVVKSGGRYGVRLRANAQSLHIMKVEVRTEVSPIIGTEKQSEEMLAYLNSGLENNKKGIWETNLFGKSLDTLVKEGINSKIHNVPEEAQVKIRKTLTRIVNESKGGVLCVLI